MNRFASAIQSAIKNENNRVRSEIKKWTDSHVRGPIDKMQKLKTEIENMPMVDFVNQNTKLLEQAK